MITIAGVLPHEWLTSSWYAALTAFVAVNTILYLVLSVSKVMPRLNPGAWLRRRDGAPARRESRSIYGDAGAPVD